MLYFILILLIYGPNMCFYFQHFALGKGDEEVISTLHYFSKIVDEVIWIANILFLQYRILVVFLLIFVILLLSLSTEG